jgi:hypothetical protein
MSSRQQRLIANFRSFVQFLTARQIDYHLGVATTGTDDPA